MPQAYFRRLYASAYRFKSYHRGNMEETSYIGIAIGVFLGVGTYQLFLQKPFKRWLEKNLIGG